MTRVLRPLLAAGLLAGPTILAFFSGGFFAVPRLWAAVIAWAFVLVAAVVSERPLPSAWPPRIALLGMALLTGWTALSVAWAPLTGPAVADLQRLLLYLGALVGGTALLRPRRVAAWVEPGLALGSVVVIGYGLAGRLVPGIVDLSRTPSAQGRLEQPLTYWNAVGALAAIGLVLVARIAGDGRRPGWMRAAAAAAAAPLGMGVYLSFSRGALLALAAGCVLLALLDPAPAQVRALMLALLAGTFASLAASRFPGVESLAGDLPARELDGAAVLAILAAISGLAAGAAAWMARAEAGGRVGTAPLRLPRPAVGVPVLLALLVGGVVLAASFGERSRVRTEGASAGRLATIESNRYQYWDVALRSFADEPLRGLGSGGFRVTWLRERSTPAPAKDAHSLYIETAAELGVVGLLLLTLLLGAVFACARRARRGDGPLIVGMCAALLVWATHAGLDWDWEMPALSLVAILLAAALAAAADDGEATSGAPPPVGS